MSKTTWVWACVVNLVLICADHFVRAESFFEDIQLYEGSRCELRNGAGQGVCTKTINCPGKMVDIEAGNYSYTDRCGFFKFDEIVCCATSVLDKIKGRKRRADAACERYKRLVSELQDGTFFHAVVFNGERANAGEFPHVAALGYAASDGEEGAIGGVKYICGGTLISQKHVITAAHCVSNVQGFVPFEVLLGTIDLTNPDPKATQRIAISRIVRHPEYRQSFNYHDVAILELKNSVKLSTYVKPTCLMTEPSQSLTENGGPRLDILGWGAIDLEGTTSTRLLKAQGLKFVNRNECSKSYVNNRARIPNGLDDGMICVVDANSTRRADTCWGDSGGPLLISSVAFPHLAGVTSFGQACGGTTPGVYASVYTYLSWIEDQIWPTSNSID